MPEHIVIYGSLHLINNRKKINYKKFQKMTKSEKPWKQAIPRKELFIKNK